VCDHKLTAAEFATLASQRGHAPVQAQKIGFVAARQAAERQPVETRWNGRETTNTVEPGDWIVTNLAGDRRPLRDGDGNLNTYVILADKVPTLYEPIGTNSELGPVFKARATVQAVPLPAGFDIVAPWGERQTGDSGYLILNGDEVYGVAAEPFDQTYEILPEL
jgi:hypothetical protein